MANRNENDSYDELMRKLTRDRAPKPSTGRESEVKNNGEIYFSPNSGERPAQRPAARRPAQRPVRPGERPAAPAGRAPASAQGANRPARSAQANRAGANPSNQNKTGKGKKKKKKSAKSSFLSSVLKVLVVIVLIVALAFVIKIPIMGCIEDVLALNAPRDEYRITITSTMEYDDVIDLLAEKDLIKNPLFCKFIAKFMDFDDYAYPPGDYNVSRTMGVEGMLQTIANAGNEDSTVTLTFPEGLTVDQIAEKLELNGVCSKKAFYAALDSDKIYEKYEFLSTIDRSVRYRAIEGYMYPDTYEFYVGEDPYSAIYRFLDNFSNKWSDEYTQRCGAMGYSVDEVITLASIVQKEARDGEQMGLVASILYNRLESHGAYPFINCDSTGKYIEAANGNIDSQEVYKGLMSNYSTYERTGLPVGPISNPGAEAIKAALYPDDTSYFFFLHDAEGNIYVAESQAGHEANAIKAGVN